ncbi:deleted in lung and esophageal cancer protein 1-like [Ptychodera flava]|uniref:deleted in lung and esophageal cancer protein 1-like n=1 Tax=Ptychodera flava TaxID=63121 RepID=UPI00396A89D0
MSATVKRLPESEPPMYLQRPSSGKSQDISHVLASTFRELFTRDFVEQERVKNLNISRSTDDEYHERYVEQLRKVQAERERRMAEAAMLERHIMQARARAMSADERALNNAAEGCDVYHDLGLPPVDSNYLRVLDSEMLKKHHLIVPEDFSTAERPRAPPPRASSRPHYAQETMTSLQHVDEASPRLEPYEPGTSSVNKKEERRSIDKWQENMKPKKRETDRNDLALLHRRSDFLRNPRHRPPSTLEGSKTLIKPNKVVKQLGGAKATVIDTEEPKQPSVVFLASPETVVFTSYQVGQVYEMTLDLKNVSAASRQLRVIPPKSQYFTVGLGKFPGEQGIVAPGMSVQYDIRFVPDSLMDYDDFITVQTQSSAPLIVKLQGRRQPPVLTLPTEIDSGHCLVGGLKITHFIVKNLGGDGRFCIMPRKSWPTSNFQSVSQAIALEPFEVRPAVFELPANQAIIIEVAFRPPSITTFTEEITIVCDNCQVKHFFLKGEGQAAGVELASVSDGESFAMPGELCDVTAQHQIKFQTLNPMTYTQKKIVVRNTTNVELPFCWQIFKPHIGSLMSGMEGENEDMAAIVRHYDLDSAFYITPEGGTLTASETQEFTLTFAPMKVGTYHDVIHLILQQIPELPQPPDAETGEEEDKLVTTEKSPGDMPQPSNHSKPKTPEEVIPVRDVTGLEIEMKGACDPLNVEVRPYAILIPGQLLVATTIRRQFLMENQSITAVNYKWSSLQDVHIIEVENPEGEIAGGEILEMNMTITGGKPGRIDHTLVCEIEHRDEPLTLRIQAEIKGPEVAVRTPSVDFGLVRFGQSATQEVLIENTSQVAAKWKIQESEEFLPRDEKGQLAISDFVFTPSGGELAPLGSVTIQLLFQPSECKRYKTVFEVLVEDGVNSFLSACGEVQHPQACLLSCQLEMPEVYVGVPVTNTIKLLNQTLLGTVYKWGKLEGTDASQCSVSIAPESGNLGSREELSLEVTFTAHQKGPVIDCKIPCQIEGMDNAIYLAMLCDVKGLSVTYTIPNDISDTRSEVVEGADLMLDFGKNIQLGSNPKKYVHLTNNSAIAAPFNIAVDYFIAGKPPTPPEMQKGSAKSNGQRRSLLGRTPNLSDPLSKTSSRAESDFSKAILRDGRGAAFVIHPETGILPPFGEQVIEITAFTDMWGHYNDTLIFNVDDLDPTVIPIEMSIEGCPLNFQMMAALKEQMPIVRFGTHVSGVPPVSRPMRVNNTSPYDIRVDWETYNLAEGDSKLIDLLVNIGDPFPLRDANGEEIIPEKDVKVVPMKLLPTDKFFVDTPDTDMTSIKRSAATKDTDSKEGVEETPKLITVRMREHEGIPGDQPFTIEPRQVVIPARSHVMLTASFIPFTNSMVEEGTDCVGYAQGFMSLDTQRIQTIRGYVSRQQALDVPPLRLDFTAHVKPAMLTIETLDDDGMVYNTAASDLMQDGHLVHQFLKSQSCKLTNMTETPLNFKIVTHHPFVLVGMDPDADDEKGASAENRQKSAKRHHLSTESEQFSLRPQYNLQVKAAFCLTMDLIHEYLYSLENDEDVEGVSLIVNETERKLQFSEHLEMRFNNDTIQTLPLSASITIPSLILSHEMLDFGTCLVGQQRELEIFLKNPTGSDCFWTATIDKASRAVNGMFSVTPASGFLEAHRTHISKSKAYVKIQFTAKHNTDYECIFVFQGMLGEETRKLCVKGQGSYDGRHEALVNI